MGCQPAAYSLLWLPAGWSAGDVTAVLNKFPRCQCVMCFIRDMSFCCFKDSLQCFVLVWWQEGHPACKKMGDGGAGHSLVRMEWCLAGWLVCLTVYPPLHHKVQKFSSGTGSPGWSRKKGRKTVVRKESGLVRLGLWLWFVLGLVMARYGISQY